MGYKAALSEDEKGRGKGPEESTIHPMRDCPFGELSFLLTLGIRGTGRATLISSVTSLIPTYTMLSTCLPKGRGHR